MPKVVESAGGIVLGVDGRILIVNQNNNSWSLPKGHVEPGEDALEAAKREILEESGVSDLTFIRALGTYERAKIALSGGDDPAEKKRITLFLFTTRQKDLKPLDPHNPEARWVEPEKVAAMLTHKKDAEFFLSVLDGLKGL